MRDVIHELKQFSQSVQTNISSFDRLSPYLLFPIDHLLEFCRRATQPFKRVFLQSVHHALAARNAMEFRGKRLNNRGVSFRWGEYGVPSRKLVP